ncbi:cytochrome b/b6 domain-containing protein [Leucobacter sp. GX24907]
MTVQGTVRRGLPRVGGGESWPPETEYAFDALETGATLSDPLQLQPKSAAGASAPAPAAADTAATESGESVAATPAEAPAAESAATSPGDPVLTPVPGVPVPESVTSPLRALGEPVVTEYEAPLRQGLPRTTGGEAWPPAGTGTMQVVLPAGTALDVALDHGGAETTTAAPAAAASGASAPATTGTQAEVSGEDRVAESEVALRRGLPRDAGGDPWPPAGTGTLRTVVPVGSGLAEFGAAGSAEESVAEPVAQEGAAVAAPAEQPTAPAQAEDTVPVEQSAPAGQPAPAAPSVPAAGAGQPAGALAQEATAAAQQAAIAAQEAARAAQQAASAAAEVAVAARQLAAAAEQTAAAAAQQPSGWRRWSKRGRKSEGSKPDSGSDSEQRPLWVKIAVAAVAVAVLGVAAVLIVRAVLATGPLQEFLTRYPGEYHLPETAEPGFPAWAKWTHFLNFFFMVQIVRSGLQVRTQKKPAAYWTPKRSKNGEGKISLALWFHQSLDILWLVNGAIFVVLLFVSGHWMRIVPTSWEVFPNALSAMLQYISLDWPTEDGWVNYNSLQQLMYFIIVFIAAPLAAVSGFRMSGMWSKSWKRLSSIYPVEVARAIHFPTMLFFVFFVIVHVVLVFTTGALKNLNHMYGEGPVVSWVGLGFFALGLAVVAGVWVAARPLILAPIASLFGRVSNR